LKEQEVAASPVIGVMLMVVVTVILAAAVSAFSSGLTDQTEVTPAASFDIEMRKDILSPTNMGGNGNGETRISYIAIQMVTGDPIPTEDLKIITINPNARGDNKTMEVLPNVNNTRTDTATFKDGGVSPFWNLGTMATSGQFFGEYLLEPGMTMVADEWSNYPGAEWDPEKGVYNPQEAPDQGDGYRTGMQAMFADWGDDPGDSSDDTLHDGDVVTVKIVYIPTDQVIFQQDVVVR
jgi:FlaG/FlaF family flagellin (archaellin)